MVDNTEFSEKLMGRVPAGRWGRPGDFKAVTVFLASHASDYITGNHIFVDGGWHIM
jgi:2-deoxy-D-gluconate 3-dehydrogenase